MFHYTDDSGYKGISSQAIWKFTAAKPPGDHPLGAYFTTLPPNAPRLASRLRIPRRKLEWVFSFSGERGLEPYEGDRGRYIFWSPEDYFVEKGRQVYNGASEDMP